MKLKTLFLLGLLPLALTACDTAKPQESNDSTVGNIENNENNENNGNNGNNGNTVVENKNGFTLLMYICGSDLESDRTQGGLASSDIQEILSVSGQPEDVNIVMQTGGATRWASYGKKLGINASKSQRWHVENQTIVLDEEFASVNMGESSSLESFLTWGLQKYPSDRVGVILWNHGGAMQGVCYDELHGDDSLLNSEVNIAFSNTFNTLKRTEKLEFIGYDACLMAVQDVAEFNSKYFNYMVSSQEAEAGYGWDYDNWIDELYAKKPTIEILTKVCDSFISDNNVDEYGNYSTLYNDQTLSVLDLSKMENYMKAWEDFAEAFFTKAKQVNKKSTIRSTINKAKRYAVDEYQSEDYYGTYDALDLLKKVKAKSDINPGDTIIDTTINALNDLVVYNKKGARAGSSNGICCFYASSSNANSGSYYTKEETHFTKWANFNTTYGY